MAIRKVSEHAVTALALTDAQLDALTTLAEQTFLLMRECKTGEGEVQSKFVFNRLVDMGLAILDETTVRRKLDGVPTLHKFFKITEKGVYVYNEASRMAEDSTYRQLTARAVDDLTIVASRASVQSRVMNPRGRKRKLAAQAASEVKPISRALL